jgi:hypothetical protein
LPLAVDKTGVAHYDVLLAQATRALDDACLQVCSQVKHVKASIYYDQLPVRSAPVGQMVFANLTDRHPIRSCFGLSGLLSVQTLILAVKQPAKAVLNFPVPGRVVLPIDLLDVLDCVKCKIDLGR